MPVSEWYQQALTPAEVYECNLRLGLIPESDHAQALVELKDPITGILIAQWSNPHQRLAEWTALLEVATQRARVFIDQSVAPF